LKRKKEHINKYASLAHATEKKQHTFFNIDNFNSLSLDPGTSKYPEARVCIKALEGYCDVNKKFTNFLPNQRKDIDREVYKSMTALIYDYGGHLEDPKELDQSWADWQRAEDILNHFDDHQLIGNEEPFECGVNIKEVSRRLSLRIFGLYDEPKNVFVAVCIDPYHLVFPNKNRGDGFTNHHSHAYTASLKDYFFDDLKCNGRIFENKNV
jgi:hypothetical protein